MSSPLVRSLSQAHSLVPLAANDDCQEELPAQEVACQVRPERLCFCSKAGVKGVSYNSTGTARHSLHRFPHSGRLENGGPNTEQGPRVLQSWMSVVPQLRDVSSPYKVIQCNAVPTNNKPYSIPD